METSFGRRQPQGLPTGGGDAPRRPTHRLRSRVVAISAVGVLALSVAAAAEWRENRCRQRPPGDPDPRPAWCDTHGGSSGHASGHGFFSGGGIGHASFGGFGAHGSGHGGG